MLAIYSIRLNQVFYASDDEEVRMFINDRARNKKDFNVLQLSKGQAAKIRKGDIERQTLIQPYELDRLLTADEFDVFEANETPNFEYTRNINNLIKSAAKLKFINDDEFHRCNLGLHLYHKHISVVMDYDNYCDVVEDCCFDWMLETFNMEIVCDRIIADFTGKMSKEQRQAKGMENND